MKTKNLEFAVDSVRRQLKAAQEYKASLSMKALLPPAGITEPERYAEELQPHIKHAESVIASFEASLSRLEADLNDEQSRPVQFNLFAA